MALPRYSRFRETSVVEDDLGREFFGEWVPPASAGRVPERIYVISERDLDRPDIIAFAAYGDETLWWYVMAYNGINDPFSLSVGDRLRLPVTPPRLPETAGRKSVLFEGGSSLSDAPVVPEVPSYTPPVFRRAAVAVDDSPIGDGFDATESRLFNFGFPVPSGIDGFAHFVVQVSLQPDFSSLVRSLNTASSVERWSYYNHLANDGGGSHVAFPLNGVDAVVYQGQSVYYTFQKGELVLGSTYYFRYKTVVDDEESQWYAPPAVIV